MSDLRSNFWNSVGFSFRSINKCRIWGSIFEKVSDSCSIGQAVSDFKSNFWKSVGFYFWSVKKCRIWDSAHQKSVGSKVGSDTILLTKPQIRHFSLLARSNPTLSQASENVAKSVGSEVGFDTFGYLKLLNPGTQLFSKIKGLLQAWVKCLIRPWIGHQWQGVWRQRKVSDFEVLLEEGKSIYASLWFSLGHTWSNWTQNSWYEWVNFMLQVE